MDETIEKLDLSSPTAVTTEEETVVPSYPKSRRSFKKPLLILGVVLLVLLLIGGILGLLLGVPLSKTYADTQKTIASAREINTALKSQDIKKTSEAISKTQSLVKVVQADLRAIGWAKSLPVVGPYIADGEHGATAALHGLRAASIMTQAVEPYADLLGLEGQGTYVGGTAEDRLAKMVETFDKVTPQIDQVAVEIEAVKKELAFIDPNRYPEEFRGRLVRSQIVEAKNIVTGVDEILTQARPLVKHMPALLGSKGEAKYMILFQNDKELRPTGGFITAYAVFRIEKGKIALDAADDIYKLDDTVGKKVAPPDPIAKYLNVFSWRLRDSNFSPDFYNSMKAFEDIYASSSQKKKLDGILAVDTHLLVRMMDVLGPIKVYDTEFNTKIVPQCNCPMVVYELLKQAGTPRGYWVDNRKDMIGQLLSAMMKKALATPKQVYAPLFQAAIEEATQKHLLIYLHNEDAEKGIEVLNFAGRIKTNPGGDYLHINDANLGGAKSNLYVTQAVTDKVMIHDGGADVELTIDYKFPHGADNCSLERKEGLCLAGIYRDYLRVYLPLGASVKEVKGFENKSTTFEDLGHTVVDGFFTVVPQGLAQIKIKYTVKGDFKKNGEYKLMIQKQPGTVGNLYKLSVDGKDQQPFNLTEDKEIVIKL